MIEYVVSRWRRGDVLPPRLDGICASTAGRGSICFACGGPRLTPEPV